MKKHINIFSYLLRLSFKNIFRDKIRSFLLLISFIGIALTLYLSVTSNQFLTLYYENQLEETYQDFDIKIETNQTYDARFFSLTPLLNEANTIRYINHYLSLFELNTLIYKGLNQINVKTIAADESEFFDYLSLSDVNLILDEKDIMITESLSKKENLMMNDSVSLKLGTSETTYNIKYILKDKGLFSGDVIYVNKQVIIKDLISILNPNLPTLPDQIYKKFSNKLYLSLKDSADYDLVINKLYNIPEYQNLNIDKPFHIEKTTQLINSATTFMTVITAILSISMLIFLYTNIMIFYHHRKKQQTILSFLGYSFKSTFLLLWLELFIAAILGITLGIVFGQMVVNFGLSFMGSSARFSINYLAAFLILLVITTTYCLTLLIVSYFDHKNHQPLVEKKTLKKQLLILSILMTSVLVLYLSVNHAVVNVIVFTVLLIHISLFIVDVVLTLFKHSKYDLVYYLFKITSTKTVFKYYLTTLLISFLAIFILFYVNSHVDKRINTYQGEYQLDFIMTNLNQRYDQTYQSLQADDRLILSRAHIYQNVKLEDQYIGELVFINDSDIKNHFNIDIDDAYLANFIDNAIMLPYKYHYLLNLNVGDDVLIENNQNLKTAYTIVGFFDKQLGNMAFVKLNEAVITPNVILISTQSDLTVIKNSLTEQYAKHLIFIIDYNTLLQTQMSEMSRIKAYMNIVVLFILSTFLLSIINHSTLLFQSLKLDFSRLDVAGLSKKRLAKYILAESLIIYSILILFSVSLYFLILNQLLGLYLIFNVYEKLWYQVTPIIFSIVLTLGLFTAIRLFYLKNIKNVTFSSNFKDYN